jgi:hypothetical protein
MNFRRQLTIGLALVGVALGLTTVQANAQPVLKGTFELPAAAYFGDTLLHPGHYTIWMSTEVRSVSTVPVIHLIGEGVNTTFLAIARPAAENGHNFLDVTEVNGTYVIRAFDAGVLGESFAFGVTKSVKNKALRASAEPALAVPVSMGAGL